MRRMLSLFPTVFLQLELLGASRFLLRAVIAVAARGAFEPDVFTHDLSSFSISD